MSAASFGGSQASLCPVEKLGTDEPEPMVKLNGGTSDLEARSVVKGGGVKAPTPRREPEPMGERSSPTESMRWTRNQRFALFGIVGLSVMALGALLLYVLIEQFGVPLVVAYPIQVVLAINLNFLLNYGITWSDRRAARRQRLGRQWLQFVSGRLAMLVVSSVLFSLVVWWAHYLIAHLVSVGVPAIVNYVFNDRIVFAAGSARTNRSTRFIIDLRDRAVSDRSTELSPIRAVPTLSIIVPVKGNQDTIMETVASLLSQRFEGEYEVIVVVDRDDPAHARLATVPHDPRLVLVHPTESFPIAGRDSNWRRALGLGVARGSVFALTDADMTLGPDWAQTGVDLLANGGVDCVAGVMAAHDRKGFWSSYVDTNALGAKTPRYVARTVLTPDNFGRKGTKPGVTANMFFTRTLHEEVGPPPLNFVHTYEDYAYFRDMVLMGQRVLCTPELSGIHHHRDDFRSLVSEYVSSGQGCADFVWAYPRCPLSRNRLIQASAVVLGLLVAAIGLVVDPPRTIGLLLTGLALIGAWNALLVRSPRSLAFPVVTAVFGLVFTAAFLQGLTRRGPRSLAELEVPTSVATIRFSEGVGIRGEAVGGPA